MVRESETVGGDKTCGIHEKENELTAKRLSRRKWKQHLEFIIKENVGRVEMRSIGVKLNVGFSYLQELPQVTD